MKRKLAPEALYLSEHFDSSRLTHDQTSLDADEPERVRENLKRFDPHGLKAKALTLEMSEKDPR